MDINQKLIHLHHCRGAGWKTIKKIISIDPSLQTIFTRTHDEWKQILPLPQNKLTEFYCDLHSINIQKLLKQYENNGISAITIIDSDYPELLKQIFDPPWVLYLKGDSCLLNSKNGLGVVGARKPSQYGAEALKMLLPPLMKKNFVIISGLAAGIDEISHRIALKENGKTIGVLGGGHFHIYPKNNIPLGIEIMKKGALISEIPPSRRPEPWMFAVRNRIISGLSRGVFVVEAKIKSGSLITAQCALEQGREVFALPGNIISKESEGTNFLIKEGAKLVQTSSDIEEEF
ncbi:DNA-processing protein DprA [Bacillus sp. MUM 13]|uniref:DNA-processing protein DprA n=1 Tax=Bacillus sp. MUM 13 TaxID=1678001 RepID=UPI0008F5ED7C|nr:DNA-processing protein DprA [Bacillus sp. MUM 13]OIK15269.1 DNA protecting protein DprA [Bacillus sp. MUM 13]